MKDESVKKKVLWIFVVIFFLSACGSSEAGVEVHEAWVRSALQGENGAVYLILHNHTDINDALIGVTSDVAEVIELHLSEVDASDVMRMTPLEEIEMGADAEIAFKSGGYHIMLVNLQRDLQVGDEVTLTFDFEHYQDVMVSVPVLDVAGAEEQNQP